MPRLFVALHLPAPLKQGIRELQSGLRNARWLTEDGLHLTLAFIGEVDGSAQRRIEATLANVAAPALRMELHRLGCFPPRGAPRVLWTGASPKAELVSLARMVRHALGHAGVTLESLIPYGNEPEGLGVSWAVGDVGMGLSERQMLS